jgi:hypothetical protein
MKMEVVKLPDFYGDPSKDTITALEIMVRVNKCQVTNEWNDIMTFSYFQLVLCGQADKSLSSVVRHLQIMPAQKMWTRIRPSFITEFAAFSDDKLIIDGLANLSHRPGENPRIVFSQLEELIYVLKENYPSYRVKPDRPAQEAAGGYSEDSLTKAINDNVDNFAIFMFTQMFKAAAPENVCRLLSHKDQTRLTVEDAYKIYFTNHRLEMDKKSISVHAVNEESDNGQANQQDVAAFRPQQRQQNWGFQSNSNRGNNRSRGQSNRSNFNNSNRQNYNQSNQPKSNASETVNFVSTAK